MSDRSVVTFKQSSNGGWIGAGAALCNSEVDAYIGKPPNCKLFYAVFTKTRPEGRDYYELRDRHGHVDLRTQGNVAWLGGALALMRVKYRAGFRYVEIEYDGLEDKIITFRRPNGNWGDWVARGEASLCGGTLAAYVGIPENCKKFNAIFSTHKPESGGHFALRVGDSVTGGAALDTEQFISFYDDAKRLIKRSVREGYRYVSVEYDV